MRLDFFKSHLEWRDSIDVRLGKLVVELGYAPLYIPNNLESAKLMLQHNAIHGFILTGGNTLSVIDTDTKTKQRDKTEQLLFNYANQYGLPMLGICRGCQHIYSLLGGSLQPCKNHVRTSHDLTKESILNKTNNTCINSFHEYACSYDKDISSIIPLIVMKDQTVESFISADGLFLGIMWHPEREDPFPLNDLHMISNHFNNTTR